MRKTHISHEGPSNTRKESLKGKAERYRSFRRRYRPCPSTQSQECVAKSRAASSGEYGVEKDNAGGRRLSNRETEMKRFQKR